MTIPIDAPARHPGQVLLRMRTVSRLSVEAAAQMAHMRPDALRRLEAGKIRDRAACRRAAEAIGWLGATFDLAVASAVDLR